MESAVRGAQGARDVVRPDLSDATDARFRTLVQSPLRAGLLRHLNARPEDAFEIDALMQAFGRMRLDIENCVRELADSGMAVDVAGTGRPPRFQAVRPADPALAGLLDTFLERRATVSSEDQSPSVQRLDRKSTRLNSSHRT